MRDLLGGKGANVGEMTRILGAERVPAGFTITTEACVAYMEAERTEPDGLDTQVDEALGRLEEMAGKRLGDPDDPLLVSVRSGARESMPGMLDTVLNLGLNDAAGRGPGALDLQRALRLGLLPPVHPDVRQRLPRGPGRADRGAIKERKQRAGVELDTELSVDHLRALVDDFKALYRETDGRGLLPGPARAAGPVDPRGVRLVGRRARRGVPAHQPHPRRVGHRGERPADGVRQRGRALVLGRGLLARRDHRRARALGRLPGERAGRGRGVRRSHAARPLRDGGADARRPRRAAGDPPHARGPLPATCRTPSSRSRRGTCTCSRRATPSARRRPRCGSRWTPSARGCSTGAQALATVDAASLEALLHKTFERGADFEVIARGVNASPGAAKGEIVFTARDAVARQRRGPRRDPGAPVHRGRRRGRLLRRPRDPHQRGRQGQPRRAGGAGHGAALRVRGVDTRDRRARGRGARGRDRCSTRAT